MKMKNKWLLLSACSLVNLLILTKQVNTKKVNNLQVNNLQINNKTLNKKQEAKEEKLYSEQFTIKLESKWDDLDKNNKIKLFSEKWILAADIIIKKTAPENVFLDELRLSWYGKNGKKINKLIASLYEKNSDKNFMPIEQYFICDSTWKKSEQQLILKFEKPKMLFAVNKLSLVLTIPKDLISTLKNGHFTLDAECLPAEYKEYASEHDLCLYLGEK